METKVLPATQENIELAAGILREGGLVAMPTETVYGLAANALDEWAVQAIFAAKGRPQDNPLIVHIATTEEALPLCAQFPFAARILADAFWPGPLTMVLPKSELVPGAVSAGLGTVGLRLPAHPVARELISRAGVPLAAPSANLSGRPSPTTAAHVLADLNGRIPLILDGGPAGVGVESTVLSLAGPPLLLRPGGVTLEELEGLLGEVTVHGAVLAPFAGQEAASPGMKYRHYAPDARVLLAGGPDMVAKITAAYDSAKQKGLRPCILCAAHNAPAYAGRDFRILYRDGPEEAARRLFLFLRELDGPYNLLLAEELPKEGMGLSVMNRLLRSAGFSWL